MSNWKSKNNLDFLHADSLHDHLGDHSLFKIGTCHGQYGATSDSYYILTVLNDCAGNGHLDDVFEWFERSCVRDSKNLLILEIFNAKFYDHCIEKRGFIKLDKNKQNLVKIFDEAKYKNLLENGNEIIMKGSLQCI